MADDLATTHSLPPVSFPLVARQPIFDRKLGLHAYELLYREIPGCQAAAFEDPVLATATVVLGAFVDIGFEQVTGGLPAFLNVPQEYLAQEHPLPAVGDRLAVEIINPSQPSEAVLTRIRKLKQQGHRIALDDFIYRPELESLLELADIVKLDVVALTPSDLEAQVGLLRSRSCKLLAEKVETQDDYDRCVSLGFDYFQGFFFHKPRVVQGRRPSTACLGLVDTLGKIYDPGTDVAALSRIVSHDVAMTYRLLKCLNSAAFSLTRKVESVPQAAMLLGERKLRQWITLMALTSSAKRPHELIISSILRASMCELVGLHCGRENGALFTVGLLSVLDALLDQPMEKALAGLPLSQEVQQAILQREGTLGDILTATLACERADYSEAFRLGITETKLAECLTQATAFAEEFRGHLTEQS